MSGTSDQTLSFSYDQGTDGIGRLTGASDANHSMSFGYDALGEMTAMSQMVGGATSAISYGYTNGDLTSITTPSGQSITYAYNADHQVTSIAVDGTTVLTNASYEPFGSVDGWTWGNGGTLSRSFNGDGLIAGISSSGAQQSLSYDSASRIDGITNTASGSSNWTYGYDTLDRLTSAAGNSVTEGWTYDGDGNRVSETGTTPSTYSISTTSNQISGITGTLSRTYGYDAAGNTLSDSTDTDTYNDAGRLKAVTNTSGTTTFIYNALGQMIEASGPSGTTLYVYNQAGHLLGEYDGSGNLIQETVWLGDIPVATLRPSGSSVTIYYVETDQLDTPREVVRPSDNVIMWSWFTGPFGVEAPNTNPQAAGTFSYDLRLPGQIAGTWGSTLQNNNRDYDPAVGRYIESDPLGLNSESYSTYAYAFDSPLSLSDSLGLCPDQDKCKKLLEEMDQLVNAVRVRPTDPKGLAQRFRQFLRLQPEEIPGHTEQIINRQEQLQKKIQEYIDSGCGDPPAWATDFANKPIPQAPDNQNNSVDPQTQQKMIQDTTEVGVGAILLRLLFGALAF